MRGPWQGMRGGAEAPRSAADLDLLPEIEVCGLGVRAKVTVGAGAEAPRSAAAADSESVRRLGPTAGALGRRRPGPGARAGCSESQRTDAAAAGGGSENLGRARARARARVDRALSS